MDGLCLGDWRTVYNGCRSANMVFILDDGGHDCFDFVRFEQMEETIKKYKTALETITTTSDINLCRDIAANALKI